MSLTDPSVLGEGDTAKLEMKVRACLYTGKNTQNPLTSSLASAADR